MLRPRPWHGCTRDNRGKKTCAIDYHTQLQDFSLHYPANEKNINIPFCAFSENDQTKSLWQTPSACHFRVKTFLFFSINLWINLLIYQTSITIFVFGRTDGLKAALTSLVLLGRHQSINTSNRRRLSVYIKEIARGPSLLAMPHTHSARLPSHPCTVLLHRHGCAEPCFQHTEQRRAKRQLGQRGHNLSGNSAAKPQITFGGILDWKWLSKFILVLQKPTSRWTRHEKHFKVFPVQVFLSSLRPYTGVISNVKPSKNRVM